MTIADVDFWLVHLRDHYDRAIEEAHFVASRYPLPAKTEQGAAQ